MFIHNIYMYIYICIYSIYIIYIYIYTYKVIKEKANNIFKVKIFRLFLLIIMGQN